MADNLQRAAEAVPPAAVDGSEALDAERAARLLRSLLEGVQMTESMLINVRGAGGARPGGDRGPGSGADTRDEAAVRLPGPRVAAVAAGLPGLRLHGGGLVPPPPCGAVCHAARRLRGHGLAARPPQPPIPLARGLAQVFKKHGVEPFDPAGDKFDPNLHQAMFEVPDGSKEAGVVAVVTKRGYRMHDRVLRAAEVGVFKAP